MHHSESPEKNRMELSSMVNLYSTFWKRSPVPYPAIWPWTVMPSVASLFSCEVAAGLDVMAEASPGFAALRLQPFPPCLILWRLVSIMSTPALAAQRMAITKKAGAQQRWKGSPMHMALMTLLGSILKGQTPCQEKITHNYTLISFFKTWKRLLKVLWHSLRVSHQMTHDSGSYLRTCEVCYSPLVTRPNRKHSKDSLTNSDFISITN